MNWIGKLIKDAMKKEGRSNYRLSKITGILKNNLTIILGKRGNPRWSTVQRILDAIGYEVILRKKGGDSRKSKAQVRGRKGN
jgi:DNA-binding phage protein